MQHCIREGMGMRVRGAVNPAPVASFLEEQLGDELAAAFIYGSVASGRARCGSDIDCFVITVRELASYRRHQVAVRFATLQRALGFSPDPEYPVEIFSIAACESVLAGAVMGRVLRDAALTRTIDPGLAESDDVEVLRALLDRRVVLRHAPVLDRLTSRTHALLDDHAVDRACLHQALGLTEAAR
ncbi:MAG: nucleotidyltransferase domain-containing protein [Mycobacteriales bacterium]